MADVKWIKIVTDIFDDEKIRFIETMPNGDEIIVIWFKILCLSGKSNSGGFMMMTEKLAYTEEMLASIFNRDIKTIRLAIQTFEKLDMVEVIDNKLFISNWHKHQNLDKLEKKKEYDRKYRQDKRLEQKLALAAGEQKSYDSRTTSRIEVVESRSTDIDIELYKEDKEEIEKKEKIIYSDLPSKSVQEIYEHWNNQNIHKHKKLSESMVKEIEKCLKKYSVQEILDAITLYSDAFYDSKYYYDHIWTLEKFIKQSNGICDWMDEGQRRIHYEDYLDKQVVKKPVRIDDDDEY